MEDKRKKQSTLFKERLRELMLLKVGRGYKISGGGKLLIWFKCLSGSWKKYIKESKNNKGVLEEIETFRNQERKYRITVKILNPKEKIDVDDMDFVYIKRDVKSKN